MPFDVAGYSRGWESIFPAYLVAGQNRYEIHIGVTPNSARMEENMTNEGILSRMGRLIAGIANAAIDKAEGVNKIAVIEQAIREIDAAADEARTDLGKARAEEYRIQSRKDEIVDDLNALDQKIRIAVSSERDDLAKVALLARSISNPRSQRSTRRWPMPGNRWTKARKPCRPSSPRAARRTPALPISSAASPGIPNTPRPATASPHRVQMLPALPRQSPG